MFEELDIHHQLEFLRSQSDEQAAALLARMAPDDAADLHGELDQDRRLPVLTLVPVPQQEKLRALLQHNPATAGRLMSPALVAVPRSSTVTQALERVRSDVTTPHQLLSNVFVTEPDGRLVGGIDTVDLVRGDPEAAVEDLEGLARWAERYVPAGRGAAPQPSVTSDIALSLTAASAVPRGELSP